MSDWQKFGQARTRPPGDWVHATGLIDVAGWTFRSGSVEQFFSAVLTAEARNGAYGVRLHIDPSNPHDPKAIAVFGFAEVQRWFRSPTIREWHVGYVPAETAAEVHRNLISRNLPIAAELYSLYRKDDYREIRFFVLGPPGHKAKPNALTPEAARIQSIVETVKQLKGEQKYDEAARLLLEECDHQEAEDSQRGWGVAPWYYEQLAVIYRRQRRVADEVQILGRGLISAEPWPD